MSFNEEFRFGSARWATEEEIDRAGLFGHEGLLLGYIGQRPVRLPGDAPLATFGGAGTGKLRTVLAYTVCGCRDPWGQWIAPGRMLINDPRGELAAISLHNQIRFGKPAYCINPYGLHGLPQHRVNPWNILREDSRTFHADVKLLVADLIPLPHGDEKYFSARAREWAEALIRNYIRTQDGGSRDAITMPAFYELVNAIEDPSIWEAVADSMLNAPDSNVQRVAAEMDSKRSNAPKEYGAIMGSLFENISFLSDPAIRDTLGASDFSLEMLCQRDCTIYLMIPAEYLSLLAPMQRAVFGSTMLYKNRHPSSPQVLLVIDEAAQLGNFEALMRAYSYGRGMGIRTWSLWQNPEQITRNLGPSALSTLIESSQSRQFIGTRSLETARTVSTMLGQQTLEYDAPLEQDAARRNRDRALHELLLLGRDPFEAGANYAQFDYASVHRTKQARALMTPDEILTMSEGKQVLFISGLGLHPILADKCQYDSCPEMEGAYLPNPYHGPRDRVRVAGHWNGWARVITERVPKQFADWPQYQSGEWSYVEGYRPA